MKSNKFTSVKAYIYDIDIECKHVLVLLNKTFKEEYLIAYENVFQIYTGVSQCVAVCFGF